MKIDLGTIEVTDEQRRAINQCVGMKGLATRDDIRRMAQNLVYEDLVGFVEDAKKREAPCAPK